MRFRLREKILVIVIAAFLLSKGINSLVIGQLFRKEYTAALQSKIDVVANTVKSQVERLLALGIVVDDIEGFDVQCGDVLQKHQDLSYVMVVRSDGEVLFHSGAMYQGSRINSPDLLKALILNRQTACVSKIDGKTYYNSVVPIGNKSSGYNAVVVVGFPASIIDEKVQELHSYSFTVDLASLFISAVLLLASLSISVTKPLSKLVATIQEIRDSSDLSKRVQKISNDELGDLAQSFNQMTEDLQKRTTSIDNLNREIELRKKIELSLRRSEDKYKTLLKNIPQRIFYKDINSVYLLCNASYAEDLGITPDEIKGKTDYNFYPVKLADKYTTDDKRVIESGKREELEEKYIVGDKEIYIHMSKSPVVDEDGNIIGVFGIFWDITASKMAEQRQNQLLEQLEKVNQELKDFAYIVSHDLKAPLRGIKTLAGWMLSDYADKLDEEGREQLKLLSSRVDRMQGLIEGILQYSRIGRMEEEERLEVDLNKLMADIIDMLAPPENITITVENELPVIECEQTRITQVFQNLISNAIKYVDKPEGLIKVGCIEESGYWKFNISDNGPGIEKKYFDKIFQIFQTLSPRDEYESTGIGLTVIKKIIEMYGGRIWVESKIGEGSTFYLTLPIKEKVVNHDQIQSNIVN